VGCMQATAMLPRWRRAPKFIARTFISTARRQEERHLEKTPKSCMPCCLLLAINPRQHQP
jgi:hypothetical protein